MGVHANSGPRRGESDNEVSAELAAKVEDFIDMMEEQGMPLVPWQAEAFRAIMLRQDYMIRKTWRGMQVEWPR